MDLLFFALIFCYYFVVLMIFYLRFFLSVHVYAEGEWSPKATAAMHGQSKDEIRMVSLHFRIFELRG